MNSGERERESVLYHRATDRYLWAIMLSCRLGKHRQLQLVRSGGDHSASCCCRASSPRTGRPGCGGVRSPCAPWRLLLSDGLLGLRLRWAQLHQTEHQAETGSALGRLQALANWQCASSTRRDRASRSPPSGTDTLQPIVSLSSVSLQWALFFFWFSFCLLLCVPGSFTLSVCENKCSLSRFHLAHAHPSPFYRSI